MTYRQKSLEWKQRAEALPPGEARDVFMAICRRLCRSGPAACSRTPAKGNTARSRLLTRARNFDLSCYIAPTDIQLFKPIAWSERVGFPPEPPCSAYITAMADFLTAAMTIATRHETAVAPSSSCVFQAVIWLGWTSNCFANSASVFSPLIAASAT